MPRERNSIDSLTDPNSSIPWLNKARQFFSILEAKTKDIKTATTHDIAWLINATKWLLFPEYTLV